MPLTQIDKYEIMYSANTYFPRIWLKNNGKYIGQLIFYPNGELLPQDNLINGQEAQVFYHLDDFQNAIDLLRNESPMFLLYEGTGAENGLRSFEEQVGEGES